MVPGAKKKDWILAGGLLAAAAVLYLILNFTGMMNNAGSTSAGNAAGRADAVDAADATASANPADMADTTDAADAASPADAAASANPAAYVEARVDGSVIGTWPLDQDAEENIDTAYGHNHLSIQNGEAKMTDADCPDGYCMQQREIGLSSGRMGVGGTMLICLPHPLVVEVKAGGAADDVGQVDGESEDGGHAAGESEDDEPVVDEPGAQGDGELTGGEPGARRDDAEQGADVIVG